MLKFFTHLFLLLSSPRLLADDTTLNSLSELFTKVPFNYSEATVNENVIHRKTIMAKDLTDHRAEVIYLQYPNQYMKEKNFGFTNLSSSKILTVLRTQDYVIKKSIYHFDEYSRRNTPIDLKNKREKAFLLFGGSYVYGSLLNDNETIGYFLSKSAANYKTYNYAIGSTGTNTLLAQSESLDLKSQVPQDSGTILYYFIHEHIARANGFMQQMGWLGPSPYYEIKKDLLVRNKSFDEGRSLTTKFYHFLHDTLGYTKIFKQNFPALKDHHILKTCKMISQAQSNFYKKLPLYKFYFIYHPSFDPKNNAITEKLFTCLDKNKVKIIDLRGQLTKEEQEVIEYDAHPSALMNQAISKLTLRSLKLKYQ